MAPTYDEVRAAADEIEAEMRRAGMWQEQPPAPEAFNFKQAFAMDTMAAEQWLQWVFLPRVREIIERQGAFPTQSQVATWAIRNFDGVDRADHLVDLLAKFDAMFDGNV